MALIVETGAGLANAESYASVAEATAYHNARGNADAWDAIDEKEAALRKATDYMTQAYRGRWLGTRVSAAQSLDWPRAWIPIPDVPGWYGAGSGYVSNTLIPPDLKAACAELALMTAAGALAPNVERAQSSVRVGEIAVTYDPASPEYTRFRSVDLILKTYLAGSGMFAKLVRT